MSGPGNANRGLRQVNKNWGPRMGAKQRAGGPEIQIPPLAYSLSGETKVDQKNNLLKLR